MKKNKPFVNLFLDESTFPRRQHGQRGPLSGNGLVVFQAAMAHYSESKGTEVNHFKIVDIWRSQADENRLIGQRSYFTFAFRL